MFCTVEKKKQSILFRELVCFDWQGSFSSHKVSYHMQIIHHILRPQINYLTDVITFLEKQYLKVLQLDALSHFIRLLMVILRSHLL